MLTLHSQETLGLLKYLTQPFTKPGSTTLLSDTWPELLSDVVVEKLMKKNTDLDKRHDEQHLQEDTKEICTYLGDADDSYSQPCMLPLVNYAKTYDDSTDAAVLPALTTGVDATTTPPRQQRLSIKSVSAPSKKSNKVKFTTPTGEGVNMDDDDDINSEEDDDHLFVTQHTPKTTKNTKRSTATAPLRGKRLATTVSTTGGASKNKKTEYLSDYIGNINTEEFDDNIIDDDELDNIIA